MSARRSLSEIKKDILGLVDEYQTLLSQKKSFEAGKSTIHYAGRVFGSSELQKATEAVLDFWLTEGRFSKEFEQRLAEYLQVNSVLMVNSGSSANLLAVTVLTSPKLGNRRLLPGDEVITVAAAFPTTVAPIIQNKLIPVFVDVDLETYNAIPERIEEAIGPKTRAIMLAHTLGNPWDITAIQALAKKNNLWLIEDNCDALGSTFNGKKTGGFGDLASLSFYPAHHITTGEGGAVVCSTEELTLIARSIREWGRDCHCIGGENNTCGRRFSQQFGSLPYGYDHKYVYSHIGYNLKATDIQAAIGCAQLDRLENFTLARKQNHAFLKKELERFSDCLILPKATNNSNPSWFGLAITLEKDCGFQREDLLRFLMSRKIETRNLFSGNLLLHPGFLDIEHRVVGSLENSNRITTDTFFIGVYPGLIQAELDYIIQAFYDFMKRPKK